ncbi:DUF2812 domain-containing protein [Kurthia huakuii]|uniref:DUF2812 domain-containing protein n=1 Tax=Kurthia huakuii TaxID=1421019 RepID=UPI0004B02ADC|nr:DUF2812 domain-containing protein [Kurthia huakuii]MBM7700897.1 hypothetical protein [Kurthia huakuii]
MKKSNWFRINILKEEQWLNKTLQQGFKIAAITGWSSTFTFEEVSEPHIVRIDCQQSMNKAAFEEYKLIYEDFGWTYLSGSRSSGKHYWQKVIEGEEADQLFSDKQSTKSYYKRLMNYSLLFALPFMMLSMVLYQQHIFSLSNLYLTPGLWDMEGALFWKAFIFETPFALFRLLCPVIVFGAVVLSLKAYYEYRKLQQRIQ